MCWAPRTHASDCWLGGWAFQSPSPSWPGNGGSPKQPSSVRRETTLSILLSLHHTHSITADQAIILGRTLSPLKFTYPWEGSVGTLSLKGKVEGLVGQAFSHHLLTPRHELRRGQVEAWRASSSVRAGLHRSGGGHHSGVNLSRAVLNSLAGSWD